MVSFSSGLVDLTQTRISHIHTTKYLQLTSVQMFNRLYIFVRQRKMIGREEKSESLTFIVLAAETTSMDSLMSCVRRRWRGSAGNVCLFVCCYDSKVSIFVL